MYVPVACGFAPNAVLALGAGVPNRLGVDCCCCCPVDVPPKRFPGIDGNCDLKQDVNWNTVNSLMFARDLFGEFRAYL